MLGHPSRLAIAFLIGCTASVLVGAADLSGKQDMDRAALVAALERLIVTGEPRHTTHDGGERLQLAVDEAIARGDREIERLAIRAASPLTASISPPVSSIHEPPSISFDASTVLRVKRAMPYTARLFASLDGGAFAHVRDLQSGKGTGGRIDVLGLKTPVKPGFHVIKVRAELRFDATESRMDSWIEQRILPPLYYAVYDPADQSSAPIRALVFGPASTPVREFDRQLGAEPFAAWLSGVLSKRQGPGDHRPHWQSQYCHERTSEAGSRQTPTALCSVVYFHSLVDIGQIWFRTAEIRKTGPGVEWAPIAPAKFEGVVLPSRGQVSQQLSALPSLLDPAVETRPSGDISISSSDIVVVPSAPQPGVPADVSVTVRNIGLSDLHKVAVDVTWGSDLKVRGTSRTFVVDVAAQESANLTLQAAFPTVYGYVLAHSMQVSEHSPHERWTPDPTPENACALRIVNERLAPVGYLAELVEASGCRVR
jgi:hypothetical protein